jgi:uroporphyrinogen-III decarboxylase
MEKRWNDLSPEEKREKRFERWLSTENRQFNSPEAEQKYKDIVTRFIKVFKLEEPDRVPVLLPTGTTPIYMAGMTYKEAMYDSEKLIKAYENVFNIFKGDNFAAPMIHSGKSADLLDTKISKYPGHGLPDDGHGSQFVEGEYMKADEYDMFINDMSDFIFRRYLPRTLGVLEPFQNFPPLPNSLGFPNMFLGPMSNPQVQDMLLKLVEYGKENAKWQIPLMKFNQMARAEGYPSMMGAFAHAPFDLMGDTLRGTHGIIMDMYRQPEKLNEAMEKLVPLNINIAVTAADMSGVPIAMFPLHKGDDTMMSDKQYREFYWPTFRKVLIGIIEQGVVPLLFAEGKYNERLEIIKDLPRAGVVWYFDQTDMFKAKEILGDTACLMGNVPTSLLCTGKPQEVKEYCRKLIEICGKGGGYILAAGAMPDKGIPENIHAMSEAAFEYGIYK